MIQAAALLRALTPSRRPLHLSPAFIPPVALLLALVAVLGGAAPNVARAQSGVQFDGTNDHIVLGAAPSLNASLFTVETWFKRSGTGTATTTGTGGITTAIPLLTKGRGEAEGSNVDMNYFLGIRSTDSVLVADYEEGTGQASPGLNHPIVGVTVLQREVWYHGAVTFDGTTLRLYLNGALENTVLVGGGRLPQSVSIQHSAIGTAMTSTGTAAGFFAGAMDEARVWNVARSQGDIQAGMALEIPTAAGLIGRWGLNEGTGTSAGSTVGGAPAGTLTGGPTWVAGAPFSLTAFGLRFYGTNGYANFGNPAALGLANFTIETWFRRDGAGVGTNTGSGGIVAIPLIAKGRSEDDGSGVDVNYFLGLRETDGVLIADFEEGAGGTTPGLDHPVVGVTAIPAGSAWHHAAATYNGTTWNLYLDGLLEASLTVGQPVQSANIDGATLGSALNSTATASGFFNGTMDEARIWSTVRSGAQIAAAIDSQLIGPRTGLVARWGLNEGQGGTIASSAGTTLNGTLIGTGWSWTQGAPFNLVSSPPDAPTGLSALSITSTLVRLTWTDNSSNEARFEVERSTTGAGGPFSPLVNVGANVTTYDDTPLSPSTNYCYRVRAANVAGPSGYTLTSCATTSETTRSALDLSNSTYVGFGDPAALDIPQFTVECWFRRDGAGTTTSTGTGGVTDVIPLVAKGRGETEASNVDTNWFLGLRNADGVLIADFEEGAGGTSPSQNHPVIGVTPIPAGSGWHHAAATYDGTNWNLYLDGNLEATLLVGQPVASASTQPASIGTGLTSAGVAAGFFDGAFDEVRVWSLARTQAQIRGTANAEISSATPNLVARWGLDDASGSSVGGGAGTNITGTITGAGYAWIAPAPFDLAYNDPPAAPVLVGPANNATGVPVSTPLSVSVSDPDGDSLTVRFYGRPTSGAPGPDFTLIGLPDTQYYTGVLNGGSNAMFQSQTNWMVANRASRNIVYMVQLGDCTEHGDNDGDPIEWMRADTSLKIIENPITTGLVDGIPYGVCVGNHDQSPIGIADGTTNFYNQYFGFARFNGRAYYGGRYGTSNDNWFDLFSASGMDFISIGLEYDTSPDVPVLNWADSLLKAHPTRRGIVSSHNFANTGNPTTFSTQGQTTYDALKDNPNLFLMLCGHVAGEGRRVDTFNGATVHTLMSDYQGRTGGGSGLLRIMEFSPANSIIRVRTYSPWLGTFETDSDSSSQFTLVYDMSGGGASYTLIGSIKVASGSTAEMAWPGLAGLSAYQWYATADDGAVTVTGATRGFTTAEAVAPTAQVSSPNGGNTLTIGANAGLTWTASDNVGVTSVDLLLSRSGVAGPFTAIAIGEPNDGTYTWNVTGPTTADARLMVVAHDAGGNTGSDISDASFSITASVGVEDGGIVAFALEPVAPNPMTSRGRIGFAVPREAQVRISVLDLQGREVAVLADAVFRPGRHEVRWESNARSRTLSSGVYFVQMKTHTQKFVRRVLVVH